MNYIKCKRNEIDRCNICGLSSKLTWDHVPPKSALFERNIYANTLFSQGKLPSTDCHMRRYQNGIKYRTICEKCNNDILGRNDNIYKDFIYSVVAQLVNSDKESHGDPLFRPVVVETKINRLLRAICGHFLAMKTGYDDQTLVEECLREYVFDESMPLSGIKMFCWFYPYNTVLNVRDVAILEGKENVHPRGLVSVMATFPLGFMISTEEEPECGVDELSKYSSGRIEDTVSISLSRDTLRYRGSKEWKHFEWPVNISNDKYGALGVSGTRELIEGSRLGIKIPPTR